MKRSHRLYWALLLVFPFVAVYAPKGVVGFAVAGAFLSLFFLETRRALRNQPVPFALLSFLPLMVWAAVSLSWTLDPAKSIRLLMSLFALLVVLRILVEGAPGLSKEDGRFAVKCILVAGIIFLVLMGMENFFEGVFIKLLKQHKGGGGDDYKAWLNPGNSILAVVAWPLIGAAAQYTRNIWGGAVMFLAVAVVLFLGPPTAPIVAILASAVVFLAVVAGKARTLTVLAVLLAVSVFVFPFLLDEVFSSFDRRETFYGSIGSQLGAWSHRWAIWQFTIERIWEHPVLGWGLDSSRSIPGAHATVFKGQGEILPLHPHNTFLQVWLELGAVGAVAFALALAGSIYSISKTTTNWHHTAVLVSTIAVFLVMGLLSFGIWQNWWIATGMVSLASFHLVTGGADPPL